MVAGFFVLALHFFSFMVMTESHTCPSGFSVKEGKCIDVDECAADEDYPDHLSPCGENSHCINTDGSYYCQCPDGYRSPTGHLNFLADPFAICRDIDECQDKNSCDQISACINTLGSYYCICKAGFRLKSGKTTFSGNKEECEDICLTNKTICGNGTCHSGDGGHHCMCHSGFSNYGNNRSRCTELNCDPFKDEDRLEETFHVATDFVMKLKQICQGFAESESVKKLDGENMVEVLLSGIDKLLSSGAINGNQKVSTFLDMMEIALRLIGPFTKTPQTKRSSNYSELELLVRSGPDLPRGPVTLSSKRVQADLQLETAAGDPSNYPVMLVTIKGFTTAALLSYANLKDSADGYFAGMKPQSNQSFKINSQVVTVAVSNRDTSVLKEPVNLTFYHLNQEAESHQCAFWDSSEEGGTWSARGCSVVESNPEYTVCSCTHLSSFAVLMALYEMEDKFELQLITWVGLTLSLFCLFLCILTFSLICSIKSPRTTIHLHLSICLFIAIRIFQAGISHTQNPVGCAVVAGLLHFFYLAVFCWMCLEGIQLFRMVVLGFNTNFKTLYLMAGGYGVPAVIVTISALANAKGYGTKRHCWLSLEIVWNLFGPACVIITINIFFILITMWKLTQKFSGSNPDLESLQQIKTFSITAGAQLGVLGTTWVFECFQVVEGTTAMTYLFTIFGSLQGVLLFIIHCLLDKQVREDYGKLLSGLCSP
ncbi:LOW QUALITY PROTEIN: adhesion G protein-coupled receptor E2-like [Betta splendens]|uniref:LOW QUALITY PROTEIN: adhesion G protein-coupled receptor E2-like n=1 Tax=Betta splendens TaxID=158456 RepID=A0A9W2XYW3_BETSP|nr:LOW QUALITY PROTEIN: adhesion G protein-coupled receptor E2-like [Betta splendens]